MLSNVRKAPTLRRHRLLRKSNTQLKTHIASHPEAVSILLSVGFERNALNDNLELFSVNLDKIVRAIFVISADLVELENTNHSSTSDNNLKEENDEGEEDD